MMKKDKKNMNYPEDFKLGNGDREFADANNKGLVVHYSDEAVKLCKWYKDGAKEHNGITYVYIEFAFVYVNQNYLIHINKFQSSGNQNWA